MICSGLLLGAFALTDYSGYGFLGVGWTLDGCNFIGGFLRMLFPFTLGMLTQGDLSYVIRGIGLVKDLNDLGRIVIKTQNGVPIYLNDIGKLKYGNLERKGVFGFTDDERHISDGVEGVVQMLRGQNPSKVLEGVHVIHYCRRIPYDVQVHRGNTDVQLGYLVRSIAFAAGSTGSAYHLLFCKHQRQTGRPGASLRTREGGESVGIPGIHPADYHQRMDYLRSHPPPHVRQYSCPLSTGRANTRMLTLADNLWLEVKTFQVRC